MKPMEMAEALFGDDDDFSASEEDFEEAAADATVAMPVVSVSSVSPVGLPREPEKASPEAMAALAEHLRKKEGAAADAASQAAPAAPAAAAPSAGGFVDLARAREEALISGAAPQHYVDTVKRRKIAAAEAKMGPSLIQPVRGVRKRTARIPAATVALGQPGAYTKPANAAGARTTAPDALEAPQTARLSSEPDASTAPWSVPPVSAASEKASSASSSTPWSVQPEPEEPAYSPVDRAASAKWAAFAQAGTHRDAPEASMAADLREASAPAAASAASSTSAVAQAPASSAGRTSSEAASLTLLGNQGTRYPQDYDPSLLETFVNKHPDNDYFVKFNCPEFTSLCPITGQPDFATIYISYVPGMRMVESKSLKLYLFSFRNHGDFHEDCINIIMKDLIALMDPKYIEVWGKFTPRGGISIDPYANYGRPGTQWEKVAWDRLTHHDMYPEKVDNR